MRSSWNHARVVACGALVLIAALAPPASALAPGRFITQYQQDNWQAEQGLPQDSVQSLARTKDGYLWIGTEEGLARFDGVRFTVFNRANTPELADDLIASLLADRAGVLWIGGRRGLVRLEGGRFLAVPKGAGLPDFPVSAMLEDRAGALWVGTRGGGLYRREGERFVAVIGDTGAPGKRIRALLQDAGGALWSASELGVTRIEGARLVLHKAQDGLTDSSCFALAEDADGSLWAGCETGLNKRANAGWARFGTRDGLSSGRIRDLARDADGNLWIATEDGGLNRLHDGVFSALSTRTGFPGDSVDALLVDLEGTLWAGTSGAGLVRLKDSPVVALTEKEGLPGANVFTVFEDRDGAMWFGSRSHGLTSFRGGKLRNFTTQDGLGGNDVTALAPGEGGALWVGSYGGGVDRFLSGSFDKHLKSAPGALAADEITALLTDREGALWIGTAAGLSRYQPAHPAAPWTSYTEKEGLPDNGVAALLEDRDGAIWAGTSRGLARIAQGKLTAWTSAQGLPVPSIISLASGPSGALWLGTAGGGLLRFRDGQFELITTRQGLPDDGILAILVDDKGALWMSSNRGIFRTTEAQLSAVLDGTATRLVLTLYGVADGMKSAECYGGTQPAAWKARDGRLWFATIRGAAVIDPAHLAFATRPPPVAIESVSVAGAALGAGPASILVAQLALPAGAHAVEINYTALNLRDADRTRFVYKLEGYDPDWIEAGARRTAYYPRLPGGDYQFRVTAIEATGARTTAPAVLPISVAPAWSERTSVRLGFAALLILFGFALQRARVWQLSRNQRELERQIAERTESLRLANQELERLATRDGLTQIANRRAFDEALARTWLDHRRRGTPVSLVLCDIDHFKSYNDSSGHQAGDRALQAVAKSLAGRARRATDLAARYGGEEFVLLLPETDLETATTVAQAALAAVRALALPHPGPPIAGIVTLSLGVASAIPDASNSASDLLQAADRALYRAKEAGRNRIEIASTGAYTTGT